MMRRVWAVALLAGASGLAGCRHTVRTVASNTPLPPDPTPQMISVPPPTHPTEPLPTKPVVPTVEADTSAPAPVKKPRRIRKTAPATPPATAQTAPPAAQTAATAPPPATAVAPPTQTASATPPASPLLGQLTTGSEATGQNLHDAADLVHAQEVRVNGLSAATQAQHKTEIEQARHFLAQAGDALKSSDAEGARTLAVKAKVVLDDILK